MQTLTLAEKVEINWDITGFGYSDVVIASGTKASVGKEAKKDGGS